ncbi:MAG: 2-C-methyl-D-erythritol 4-phosphate cytidylyltransferase [Clostridioides difficile]|nr:2-C-methyl-D-erythritol 4-phosphate cytidylyltransferase [Clostridioides difficile]
MFIKVVPNIKGVSGTSFCYLVESYRENEQVPYLKAMYAKKKPRLVYDEDM